MTTQFRSRKKKDGSTVSYPIRPGTTHRVAEIQKIRLERAYPDDVIRVLKVGNKKDNLYAPFISYLSETVRKALPLRQDEGLFNSLPPVTFRVMSGLGKPSGPVYAVFYGEDGGGAAVFGKSENGEMAWLVDWHGVYPDGSPDTVLMEKNGKITELRRPKDILESRRKAVDEVKSITLAAGTAANLSDTDGEKMYQMLLPLTDDIPVMISYEKDRIEAYPLEGTSDFFTTYVSENAGGDGGFNGYYSAGALKGILRGFLNSQSPVMRMGFGTASKEMPGIPLYAEFLMHDMKSGYFTDAGSRGYARFLAVIGPPLSGTVKGNYPSLTEGASPGGVR